MRQRLIGLVTILVLAMSVAAARAQSQATNGTIEGIVRDAQGGALPGVTVTVKNTDTGVERVVVSNDAGSYRAPLLPLGTYTLSAELQGFTKFEQQGISLSAGRSAVINVSLSVGSINETITVTSEAPVAQPGTIDLGRTIAAEEIKNLPLPSRNPYNFAFLQANVTGYENTEFGVPRINANGSQMHTNYQLDGNTNTEKDRAGLRLLPVSEVLVREVKVVTNGFAPEFGQTTGMVYNAITQSGTNTLNGSASYRFKRNGMSTAPFFLAPGVRKPDTVADDITATLGGPIAKNKTHFFGAYEFVDRSLITGGQVITVARPNADRLGISLPADQVVPANQRVNFVFGKVDHEVSKSSHLAVRYFLFKNYSLNNVPGGLNTLDRATNFTDRMDSTSAQLTTTVGSASLNELRIQYARRHQFRTAADTAADGPAIVVSGIANFGGPRSGTGNDVGFDFNQGISQVIDNFSVLRGRHSYKAGVDAQFIRDQRVPGDLYQYTFPTIDSYLAAKNGTNRLGYNVLQQRFGTVNIKYNSAFYGAFVQDDWQVTPNLKVLYGLRYDLFDVPSARTYALNKYSQNFAIDKNNFGPRAGFAWTVDGVGRTVLRGSIGLMYEPPLIDFYDNAILNNGDPASYTVSVAGTAAGAPAYPTNLASVPAGFALPRQSITAVDTNFKTQQAWLSNVQFERALASDLSVSVGYVNSTGRKLPVLVDVNMIATGTTLGDGRPIYSATVAPGTRVDQNFDHVNVFQSIAVSNYNAATVTMSKRMVHGWQAQATYTVAKGTDTSPLTGTYVVGSGDDRMSDPSNLQRDKGLSPFNQTHTFVASTVLAPVVSGDGARAAILNHNQLSLILQANSGLPFNIRSNQDLNRDGVTNDRPLNLERNAGRLGKVVNLDLRYSRFVPLAASRRVELFVEAKNLFNRNNIAGVNRVIATDAAGNPLVDISSRTATPTLGLPFTGNSAYDQRIAQAGMKVTF
jgi:hypothetical protein